ncbi:MAG: four helix bundle protein [Candidatus Peribacteria bacterium]|jgi:hypothetical protein|nr:four helix bundle protein [Candidatus Peribacteria bacterium]
MPSYDNLPIYRMSMELLTIFTRVAKGFPREYRYTFGERLQNVALDFLIEVTLAALDVERVEVLTHLLLARKHLEIIKILWRASREVDILSHRQYLDLLPTLSSLSMQLEGRKKSKS